MTSLSKVKLRVSCNSYIDLYEEDIFFFFCPLIPLVLNLILLFWSFLCINIQLSWNILDSSIYLFIYIFVADDQNNQKAHAPYGWIIGGLGVGLILIILSIILCVCLRSSNCFAESRSQEKDADGKVSHKFHILRNPSFFCGSGRYICGKHVDQKQTDAESSNPTIVIPKPSSK